jgi:hypothetical protein
MLTRNFVLASGAMLQRSPGRARRIASDAPAGAFFAGNRAAGERA